jgi:hypothetical protein
MACDKNTFPTGTDECSFGRLVVHGNCGFSRTMFFVARRNVSGNHFVSAGNPIHEREQDAGYEEVQPDTVLNLALLVRFTSSQRLAKIPD